MGHRDCKFTLGCKDTVWRWEDPRRPPLCRPSVAFGVRTSLRGRHGCLNGHVHSKVQGGCHLLPEHRDSCLLSPFLGRSLPRAASASVRWVLGACPTPPPPQLSLTLVWSRLLRHCVKCVVNSSGLRSLNTSLPSGFYRSPLQPLAEPPPPPRARRRTPVTGGQSCPSGPYEHHRGTLSRGPAVLPREVKAVFRQAAVLITRVTCARVHIHACPSSWTFCS